MSFDALLSHARQSRSIAWVDKAFRPNEAHLWENLGETTRGEFYLLELERDCNVPQALQCIQAESTKLGIRLSPATVYELVTYAYTEWNGLLTVGALGSRYNAGGKFMYALLEFYLSRPMLEVSEARPVGRETLILCVRA
jgi:hypothetical protein